MGSFPRSRGYALEGRTLATTGGVWNRECISRTDFSKINELKKQSRIGSLLDDL